MRKIIIDADPGVDDVFGILLACNSKEFDILGVTTIAGNTSIENSTRNAIKALSLANRNDIPVYSGTRLSLISKKEDASYVHGNNGLGGIEYEPVNKKEEEENAVDFIIETVNNNPGEITITTFGPLTNIAEAIRRDANFSKNLKSLIIMGGGVEEGNVTPYAEFNFYKDPVSAKIVFQTKFNEIVMLGLNVTHKLTLKKEFENILKSSDNKLANFLYDITRVGAKYDTDMGRDGLVIHDPITICHLIDPTLVTLEPAKVTIETFGEKTGKSNVSFTEQANCKVGVDVDFKKYYKILFKRILNIDI